MTRPPSAPSIEKKRSFIEAVRAVVRDVGRGQIVSYGEVARRAGYPRAARAVGNLLANSLGLPWWAVVRASGEVAAHGGERPARGPRPGWVRGRKGGLPTHPTRSASVSTWGGPIQPPLRRWRRPSRTPGARPTDSI